MGVVSAAVTLGDSHSSSIAATEGTCGTLRLPFSKEPARQSRGERTDSKIQLT